MTPDFSVRITAHFERTFKKLAGRHTELPARLASVTSIPRADPHNRSGSHHIKKLSGVQAGEGQFRIRSGRFRFRYDVEGHTVFLKARALRSEQTYRR